MMKQVKKIKSKKGYALVMVLLLFSILSILTLSAIYLNNTNTRQTKVQIQDKQAYYLAHSGVEIGHAALMMGTPSLIEEFKANANHTKHDTITYGENNEDIIEITMKSSANKKRITITSKGTHKKSGATKTLTMSFPVNYPTIRKWE